MERSIGRRRYLGAFAGVVAATAGCLGGDGEEDADPEPSPDSFSSYVLVEDPPDEVYVPTHREGMYHLETVHAGPYAVSPMLTIPHPFWLVTGEEVERVDPPEDGVHLMVTVWDAETRTILPVDVGAQLRILQDGEVVDERIPWPMISQAMGFHFGDNVELPEDGTYEVELDLNPIGIPTTGSFEGRFENHETARFEFTYDRGLREEVIQGIEFFEEDRWGEPGAVEPMDHAHHEHAGGEEHAHHEMPFPALAPAAGYPGHDLGEPASGDVRFVVRYLESSPLADDEGYLLVSARTPYNRIPLPEMALSVDGDATTNLVGTLDDELGYHYGAELDLDGGEDLELVVDGPPQVSRHPGYERAFLDVPDVTIDVPSDLTDS